MNKNEQLCVTYTDTGYLVTRNILNHKFTLWLNNQKIKTDNLPYFEDIIYSKETKSEKRKNTSRSNKTHL